MFQHIEAYAGDPILGLVEQFNNDPRPHKVNLSIGIYFDENGKLPLPAAVQSAEQQLASQARAYLPMEGSAPYRQAVAELLLGSDNPLIAQQRTATVQTLGGSGALKLGADFLKRWFPHAQAYVSDPTWDNHRGIFEGAGFQVSAYPYYDAETGGVRFGELCRFFHSLPPHSIVLLHPCCHNPTGVDLNPEQWDELLAVIAQRKLIPFMDIAYQGFGSSFDDDAYAIRKAAEMGLSVFISCSFSKNMSLYGDRIGALCVVCPNADEAQLVLGQLKFTVRRIYSSPPVHGALIAHGVLGSPESRRQWQNEVYAMRDRIKAMRQKLFDALSAKLPERDFGYFIKQRGMFSYTGLSAEQVARLQNEFAVYLVQSGRICIAGLNHSNIDYVADALAKVFQS